MTQLFAGAIGEGLRRSADGERWERVAGVSPDAAIRSLGRPVAR